MANKKNQRAPYYEHSSAKPVSSGLPFLLVAAAAATFVVLGHIAGFRRAGKRLGGKAGRIESSEIQRNNGTQPRNLAELRSIHAAAAEARCRHGMIESSNSGIEQATPFFLTHKVEKLEEEVSTLLSYAKAHNDFVVDRYKVHAFVECLRELQKEINDALVDESVRSCQKMETERVQAMIFELDKHTSSATIPEN